MRAPYPDFGPPLTLRVEVRRLNLWLQPFRLAEAVHRPSQLSEVCPLCECRGVHADVPRGWEVSGDTAGRTDGSAGGPW